MTDWNDLNSLHGLEKIIENSQLRPQIIFKHSTRCSISSVAKNRLDQAISDLDGKADMHYLDLLSHRDISSEIAARLDVKHESPQVILMNKGEVLGHWSHFDIQASSLLEML